MRNKNGLSKTEILSRNDIGRRFRYDGINRRGSYLYNAMHNGRSHICDVLYAVRLDVYIYIPKHSSKSRGLTGFPQTLLLCVRRVCVDTRSKYAFKTKKKTREQTLQTIPPPSLKTRGNGNAVVESTHVGPRYFDTPGDFSKGVLKRIL